MPHPALVANRAKRELMVRCLPVRGLVQRRYQGRLRAHRSTLPALEPSDQDIVDRLRKHGAVRSSLEELGFPGTEDLLAQARLLCDLLETESDAGRDSVRPSPDSLLASPALWQWGLNRRLLDIAENYLGLPVRYRGPDCRRDLAHRGRVGLRQWHRDVEDHRQFKVMLWLRDVREGDGPFEYVPIEYTRPIAEQTGYVAGYVTDAEIARLAPREEWQRCPGPAGTVLLLDPANLFHRAAPNGLRDRYSLTFSYTSQFLYNPYRVLPLTASERRRLTAGLDSRQLSSLPPPGRG